MLSLTRYSCFLALLVYALLPMNAYGEGWSFDDARPEPGSFALGLLSGLAIHEAGHYVVAHSKGYKVSHGGLSIVYPDAVFRGTDQLKVASAGFQTQWLMTELVLRDRNGKEIKTPPGNFGAGMVCAHLGITLAYLTVLKNNSQGDIAGMTQATGRSKTQLSLAMAIPGILDAWRLLGNDVPEWVPQVSLLSKGIGIAKIWTY
jgi:hypothetical protein